MTWQDPPPVLRGRKAKYLTPEVEDQLRSMPHQWLLLEHHTRNALNATFRFVSLRDDFEMTTRVNREAGGFDIYVRYTPQDPA